MTTGINTRIKEIISDYAVKKSALAAKIGVSSQAISKWLRTGQIDNRHIEKLLELFPTVNRDWLYFGNGEKYRTVNKENGDIEYRENHQIWQEERKSLQKMIQAMFKLIDSQEEYIETLKEDLVKEKGKKVPHSENEKEILGIWQELEEKIHKRAKMQHESLNS